tara:strand:- start:1018 stop:1659 length:642 start_codon:yes stop_codon:yes gene_type:complete
MQKIIILGASGGCLDVLDLIEAINKNDKKYDILGFLDDKLKTIKGIKNYKVLGKFSEAKKFDSNIFFTTAIGNSTNFTKIDKILKGLKIKKNRFPKLIHPKAQVSKYSRIGQGTIIYQNCTIGLNVRMGDFVNILPNTVINHDCEIGDYCKLNTMCNLAGSVKIKKSCYIGSGTNIKENVKIGKNNLIGMSSVVLESFEKTNQLIYGSPAKKH